MKKLFDLYRVARLIGELRVPVFTYVPQRGVRYQESLKWVPPPKKPVHDLERCGDLECVPNINQDCPYSLFRDSKELQTADEKVKKIFSVGYQCPEVACKMYKEELIKKVRNHPFDRTSLEVQIASLTADIRYIREKILRTPTKSQLKSRLLELTGKRKKFLKHLRESNYKKFEWLLETLNLEYRPIPEPCAIPTRKQSLLQLAKLKVEQLKEEKLALLKKSYDEQKIPFLEKKITKLKEIKEKEEKYNLPVTVTDAEIEECIQKLEKTKIEVAERLKTGYKRKIHPFFLEVYDEKLLLEKEKAGAEIREQMINQQKSIQETGSSS